MNLTTFNKLMKGTEIRSHPLEWKMFLEICDLYLKRKRIKAPIVMELGPEEDSRWKFFEQLFGTDSNVTIDPHAQMIDILSISGGCYKDVKENFETFAPSCRGIIAIHDIECCRYKKRKGAESWRFWDELKLKTARGEKEFENFLFITIHRKRIRGNQRGIGVIIKR